MICNLLSLFRTNGGASCCVHPLPDSIFLTLVRSFPAALGVSLGSRALHFLTGLIFEKRELDVAEGVSLAFDTLKEFEIKGKGIPSCGADDKRTGGSEAAAI